MPKHKDLAKLMDENKDFRVNLPPTASKKKSNADSINKPMSALKLGSKPLNKSNFNKKKPVRHPPPEYWKKPAKPSDANVVSKKDQTSKENTADKFEEANAVEVAKPTVKDIPATWEEILTNKDGDECKNWNDLMQEEQEDENGSEIKMYSWQDFYECDETTDVNTLKRKNNQQQRQLCANLEISGVPRVKNEDLVYIIQKIGAYVNVAIDESDIVFVKREQPKRHEAGLPPVPIICQFTTKEMNDNIIIRIRKLRRINSNHIGFFGDIRPIYVQYHLTAYNKNLYAACRRAARQRNYQFCWVKNGRIFVRQEKTSSALRIETFEEIDLKIN